MSKYRAKLAILGHLLAFPTINQKDWKSDFPRRDVKVGDLVSINSCSATEWYVSWVREIKIYEKNYDFNEYLLESIENQKLCWWTNVGMNVFSREIVERNPHWKWDDKQFEFSGRWNKVFKRNDAFWVLPTLPEFNDQGSVTLNVRIRYGLECFENPKTFPNWRKLTMREMGDYYRECVRKYEEATKAKLKKEEA
jgi:hypothetical protein